MEPDNNGDTVNRKKRRSYYSELVTGARRHGDGTNEAMASMFAYADPEKTAWNVFKKSASPMVNLTSRRVTGGLAPDPSRWLTFPQDPSTTFPVQTLNPKVQMTIEAEPRHLVLNVERERRRRQYEHFKLSRILDEKGMQIEDIVRDSYLGLELFDDEEYDCRTPREWLQLGQIDGKQYPLPAEALLPLSSDDDAADEHRQASYDWQLVAVEAYEPDARLWSLKILCEKPRYYRLPRIYLRFLAEDPRVFASRVEAALLARIDAELEILYNLQLDCTSLDEMQGMSPDDEAAILERLADSIGYSHEAMGERASVVMTEVDRNYRRTMCDLIYRDSFKREHPNFRPEPEQSYCKAIVIKRIPHFNRVKELYHWTTLYVYPEVYQALLLILDECRNVSAKSLFDVDEEAVVVAADSAAAAAATEETTNVAAAALPLEAYEAKQLKRTRETIDYLTRDWIDNTVQILEDRVGACGKGWFDLNQRHHDVYEFMKLKRLMELVKQCMETALQTLIDASSLRYITSLELPTLCLLQLDESRAWEEADLKSPRLTSAYPAIFEIELYMDKDKPHYTTDLDLFREKLSGIYSNALKLCQSIRQVHPLVLKNLKFPQNLFVKPLNLVDQTELIEEVYRRLDRAYSKAVIPLRAYIKRYEKYRELYLLNVDEYIDNFFNEEFTVAQFKEEISRQQELRAKIAEQIPERLGIGPFVVDVRKLRAELQKKHEDIVDGLLVAYVERLAVQVGQILTEFEGMMDRLGEQPIDIEQLFEMREYMNAVPLAVANLTEQLQRLKIEYDVLEHFCYNLSDDDFNAFWSARRYPTRILRIIDETSKVLLELEKEVFYKVQLEDQIQINDRIDFVMGAMTGIAIQNDLAKVYEIAKEVKNVGKLIREVQEFGLMLNARQKLFGMPVVPFEKITMLVKSFEPYQNFWLTANDWTKRHDEWMNKPMVKIDGAEIEGVVNEMYKTIVKCTKMFPEQPEMTDLALEVKQQIEKFRPYIGIIQALTNPGMKPRHFEELSRIAETDMSMSPELTFQDLLENDILSLEETIKEISETAAREFAIERSLEKMRTAWETLQMDVVPYKDTGTYIMKIADETMLLLDDHILSTQQISFSPFKGAFEEDIDVWTASLKLTQQVTLLWGEVQKIWMYLEPIFASEDISRQLPVESKKYNTMERNWRRIMLQAFENPFIMEICPDQMLLESLRECMNLLEVVQKGLADYLESRRMIFPRFFFLSDDELLEILAQAKNVKAVQPHLKKCFENMHGLRFEKSLWITRMYSAEGEEVALQARIYPDGGVEHWLGKVEEAMRNTVRYKISQAVKNVEKLPRKKWVFLWPGQVSLCVGQMSWTAHVEKAIGDRNLAGYFKTMMQQLDDLRNLVREQRTDIERMMLEAIITIEVHARDVTQKLVETRVRSVNDFDWISQLRYYWVDDAHLKVRAVNAEFQYGYEYLGNNGRLVITPLTDRCYLTLTGALHLKFGGAPAGPAGTGKTETTKDLAKAFAIQCVVFNCSDQLDFMSMGKFFKGLASSGAWACFDEFNRIDIEVLSVIAQQIMTIQRAQMVGADRFYFEGTELSLRASCAVFITMNPGYAGRTELPDNLKALFRPVAMMVPNYALIAEISLFSCGFGEAKSLAAKITATFKLSSEQLSSQDHYDFGMRSVKTVILTAGILKREQKDMAEQQICLRALRDVNVPKFLKDDLILFNGITSDLFPRVEEKVIDYDELIGAIHKSIKEMKLAIVGEFVHKVIQLYETTIVRHGLMLVGPTGAGKTRCYEVLKKAITRLKGRVQPNGKPYTPVHTYVLNPKSITMGQLYGEYDLGTHEWTDGILSTLIRDGSAATDDDKRWYVFDGPVDAVWIENMNTVLDDNKKLCLTSGEIMRLSPCQTMMFEVEDLRVASPATVSRCGMVYMEPQGLGIDPFIDCWIKQLPGYLNEEHRQELSDLTYFFVIPGLQFLRANLKELVTSIDSGLVIAYSNVMNYLIGTIKYQEDMIFPAYLFEPWSAFALTWSIGATCDAEGRYLFSEWLRHKQEAGEHRLLFPPEGLVYDYRLQYEKSLDMDNPNSERNLMNWVKWHDDLPSITIRPDQQFSDIEIPTVDMARSTALIHYLLTTECNILCVGPSGSGKTLTVAAKLSREMPSKYICEFIIFSARTSANQTQDLIDSKLDKRRRGVYGPPLTKKQIFFIDDLNMPALETYGAQPPIELLRQYMDFKGWYDRKEIGDFRHIEDVNVISAMAPPGGGRNPVTARLLRHFHFIAFPDMDESAKRGIFVTILTSWLSRTAFQDVFLEPLLSGSLRVFEIVSSEFLPTPSKSHYSFNVRDFGKVFQGILMADPAHIKQVDDLMQLWYHESYRVYSDRLTNDADRQRFQNILLQTLIEEFHYDANRARREGVLYYGDFCNPEGRYERVRDAKKMERVLMEMLENYNSQTTVPMNLVLFQDAMNHVCRITRVLRQSPGNALLLGMGGSGRQSLTKLSTHIAEYICFQIELSKTYGVRDWRDDVKDILLKTGLKPGTQSVFLFSDTQIKSDVFLEDINNILNSGDVPNIYQPDELDKIFQAMRARVQESGLQINRSNLLSAFRKVVKNNLHVVLTMTPIGELFRARIRQFPALINLCTIDWFDPWPDSALQNVAMHFLQNVKDEAFTDSVMKSIVKTCQFMHSSVIKASSDFLQVQYRHNYVTPTSYLELISSYGHLLAKKRNELNLGISRLSTGLERLAETEIEVKDMQVLLEKMKPELEQAAIETQAMIVQIQKDTAVAEIARQEAAAQEEEASKLKMENQAIRDEAEYDLSKARPMLQAAEESLKALNKADITEVKAMKRPPVGVVLVIEAICIVKKVKPLKVAGERPGEKLNDYWTPGSALLSDAGHFLSSLENYNKEDLNEDMIKSLKGYIENPDFQPAKVATVSKACHSLCLWVHAMYNYYFVNERVKPKMQALREAEEGLRQTELTLAAAVDKLRQVEAGVELLQAKFRRGEAKQAELERQKQLCEDRMSRAVRLIGGLAEEKVRWAETVALIRHDLKNIIGDILLSAGAIAYLTPFMDTYRKRLLTSWYRTLGKNVPHTPGCSPVSVLGDPVEIRRWQIEGLPRDSLSVENAVLVTNSKRWPLFIDPQGQANHWIRNSGKQGGLSIVRMNDKDLLRVIESCIRFGRTCLIENVGLEFEASLDTVLMRTLFRQAGVLSLKIGDNIVPYSPDFRLFLTTKLPNPHYPPEIAVKVLLVNFTLTASGLADQMLSLVVMQECPDLEETRSALIVSSADMKRELRDIEDRILQRLSSSEGSAVDDVDLILTLEASKVKSEEIKIKVKSAEVTQAEIEAARSLYIPIAERAQILFFCLLDLQLVDTMYQYSLQWFIQIFINAMRTSPKNENVEIRVSSINENLTFSLFTNVCRSLFEKHKLHFAFLLCVRIRMKDNLIDPDEWRFLLSGSTPLKEEQNPAPQWLTQRSWSEIQSLEALPKFRGFAASFKSLLAKFKIIFDSQQPEAEKLPDRWDQKLDDFQKMLVLKCLRPDKVTISMQHYIIAHLGGRFVDLQSSGLEAIYKESSPTTPLIFVLSSGTDPAAELAKFADKLKMSRKLYSMSLGQGQGPRAELMLKQSIEVGNWLFFQNCHLAPSWLPRLELLVENLPDSTHRDFRLWLTSMPSPAFPVSILQNGSKMTIEPPRGVKANVMRAYTSRVVEFQEFLESESVKVDAFKCLAFSLCLFHAILLERRKFGPLGFNIPYEFTDGDFTICLSQLHMFLLEYARTPYEVLIYTAGHINYGGRITDDWDRRCVLTLLHNFYNESVLETGHCFDPNELYVQPPPESTTFLDYVNLIKGFPINDVPGLFGLHSNADISYAQAETYACLNTLLELQPREIGGSVKAMDEVTSNLARAILSGLPDKLDLRAIQKRYPVSYEESLNSVLYQEAARYNVLLDEMRKSLSDLLRALQGLVVLSETLEAMASAMFSNRVPNNWTNKAFSSLKPLGAWMEDLKERVKFIRKWQDNGIPASFWISGFYFPQAFLTGTLQNYARKYGVSIDLIDFSFKVLAQKPKTRPDDGCVVYGLFLEGCRWDGTSLAESRPKELFTSMKPMLFLPEVNHKKPESGFYECPVYKTVVRAGTLSTTGHSTNFVLPVEIPCRESPSHWIIRGAALICSLDF
uniref:Dynein heavy chain 1, axonemal n=1 Tax=Trichogramma kaykai TaxID=54128 RepID=A0ABD2WRH4_9HYME